eukprot:1642416-Amphidinium_carterae.2
MSHPPEPKLECATFDSFRAPGQKIAGNPKKGYSIEPHKIALGRHDLVVGRAVSFRAVLEGRCRELQALEILGVYPPLNKAY